MSGPRQRQSGNHCQRVRKESGDDKRIQNDVSDAVDRQVTDADEAEAAVEPAVGKPQNLGRHAESSSLKEVDIERDEVDPEIEEKMAKYVRGKPIRVQVSGRDLPVGRH